MATVRVQLTTGSFLSLIKGVSVCDNDGDGGDSENRIMVIASIVQNLYIAAEAAAAHSL